jgi:tRNA pseudouridine55 synthase
MTPNKNKPRPQQIDGILLVNKHAGVTSNAILQQVKRLFCAKKAGHTGSLDPMATGMLPVCFGEATKFSQYLLDSDKCYEAEGRLGIKTNSGDATGEIILKTDDFAVSKIDLLEVLSAFKGPIQQIPSMFSALKHQGTPLYKFARAGVDVPRSAREVMIHQLRLDHFEIDRFSVTVTCSKGTYIRNLIEDIGDRLAVGAHVTKLHRIYTAGFEHERMYTIDELTHQSEEQRISSLLPMDSAINNLPRIAISEEDADALYKGQSVYPQFAALGPMVVRLYVNSNRFTGLGLIDAEGTLTVKRLLSNEIHDQNEHNTLF